MKRLCWLPFLLLGCTDSVVAADPPPSTSSGSAETSAGTSSSSSSEATSSSSSGADASSSSSGELLDGPGCGIVPTCEERTVVGNVGVRSIEDLAQLQGASEITGTLEVADSDLECLDALACLRIVGGDVRVLGNPALRSTAGLGSVEELGASDLNTARGSVVLSGNDTLEVLEGFEALDRVRGGITLWQNASLREVAAFGGLRRLELLSINGNPVLESLSGLHDLEQLEDCNVNGNPDLCLSEIFEVCGDVDPPAGGVTANNDDEC